MATSDPKSNTNYHSNCNYSIWILPDEELQVYLSSIISKISIKFGGPMFHPHITVIGGFIGNENDLIIKTVRLAERIDSLKINFNGIGYNNEFFFSFYIKVLLTKKLLNVLNTAEDIFKFHQGKYVPHLSLAYGNYENQHLKEMLNIIDELPVKFIANNLCLSKNNEQTLEWEIISSFNFNS